MTILLDEMYPAALARALTAEAVEAVTARELGVAGSSDFDLLEAAAREGRVLLTENASDFARLAGERLAAGGHHPGVLIALSSRFSRRPTGIPVIVAAVKALGGEDLRDRLVYLERPPDK
ncbi:MAG TPA: DUF5615 family PIN-like protein [Acidimicrobiales bacterium]|nr:DUF5615 family PIN-like protein [Acidimicrobiales bacterium]